MKASEFDKIFDDGQEDVTQYIKAGSARRINQDIEQRRVNIDFPSWMIGELDREASRLGIARQSLVKVYIADKLAEIENRPQA